VAAAGRFDGYCLHFRARFDDEIVLEDAPFSAHTCWRNPLLRMETRHCARGEPIGLRLDAPDWADPTTWSWGE